MKTLFAATALLFSACAFEEPELYDVTGVWSLTLQWGAGNCQATGTTPQNVIVTERDGQLAVSTGVQAESATAGFLRDADSADMTLRIRNTDVRNDGGSVVGDVTINAHAHEDSSVTGIGRVNLSGGIVCAQNFGVTGEIQ